MKLVGPGHKPFAPLVVQLVLHAEEEHTFRILELNAQWLASAAPCLFTVTLVGEKKLTESEIDPSQKFVVVVSDNLGNPSLIAKSLQQRFPSIKLISFQEVSVAPCFPIFRTVEPRPENVFALKQAILG